MSDHTTDDHDDDDLPPRQPPLPHIYLLLGSGPQAAFFDTIDQGMAAMFSERGYRVVTADEFNRTLADARAAGRFSQVKRDDTAARATASKRRKAS